MEKVYVIVTALLTFWTVISANEKYEWELQCPVTQCKCPEEYATNLPHETDCTKFYKCSWCVPVLQDCPLSGIPGYERLHYNRRLQVCDWPFSAGCINCTIPEDDKCLNENEKISNPEDDCNKFFECINGTKELRTCPPGTCFSRTCQDCVVNRTGGQCNSSCPVDNPNCNDTCTVGDRKCHDCNCRAFYECKWIQENLYLNWTLSFCEGTLYYNPYSKTCDTADKAKPICEKACLNEQNKKY